MAISYGPRVIAETVVFITNGSGTMTLSYNGPSTDMFKSGTTGWDTQAYSLTPFTAPCTIEFNKSAADNGGDNGVSYTMLGWNTDPTTNADYGTIDHASYPFIKNDYYVYNNGSGASTGIAWSDLKKFYLVYGTDGFIRHYNGSTLLHSANVGTGITYYFDSSFYSPNQQFGGIRNLRLIKRAWNGTSYTV